jgi:hypothetical protein
MYRVQQTVSRLNGTDYPGAVLCRDVTIQRDDRRVSLRRGTALSDALSQIPEDSGDLVLHFLVPDEGDITQEMASEKLAASLSGDGLQSTDPHQGQVDLRAAVQGVLRVDSEEVVNVNRSGLALVATALDGRVVEPDETVAIVKASELLVHEPDLDRVISQSGSAPLIRVIPFTRSRVALIAGDRIRQTNLDVSSKHLAAGLRRFGADLVDVRKIPDDPEIIAETYLDLLNSGVELLLVAGSIVLDPEDPFLAALGHVDAELVRRGAPIDPGTMFWVAKRDETFMFGLASCEMYGRLSIIDLFLPYALAGQEIDNALISNLGYGGLLNDTHNARLPVAWRT